ncbi:hypothetical protein [Pandoraea sputorum]|uniref:hypothetical protein n=1 Tax=Pandoraea sputorum TaxID=93222 RepID=UPI002B2E3667|nr:hypothetical protein THI4931_17920 [Pandoraea sputorum]
MNHDEAVAFLSHAFLIGHLAFAERLSAAQIANVLSQRDKRAKFSRQSVAATLQSMRIPSEVDAAQITSLFRRDSSQELATLADADLRTAAERVADAGAKLGFPSDLAASLITLTPTVGPTGIIRSLFTPYLQMLHYQCSLAEFFDHAVTDVYEFKPRGIASEWLHKQYPHAIAGAANAFLNNAKAVEVLDIGWVRSKASTERPGAMALLAILEGMQAMGFSARRELAWWIRLWLHRILRTARTVPMAIPTSLRADQIERLVQAVSEKNTGTFGIVEQRVVDAIASTIHVGWRPKGVGDPVNATNVSTAKFGDCDFLNARETTVEAYESHAGVLTSIYIDEHIASLRKSILKRIDELTTTADVERWSVAINFIAHGISGDIPEEVHVEGIRIRIRAITFAEFLRRHAIAASPQIANAVAKHVLVPFKENRTPNEVRQKLLTILG